MFFWFDPVLHFLLLPGGGSVVVDMLFGVLPTSCGGSVFVFVLLCIILCPF